jgi:hypothetical protein
MNTVPEPFRLSRAIKLIMPREHGSWSLALEPLALGMLAAPSKPGVALAAAALSGFFLRRPLRLVLGGKPDPRRSLAFVCVAGLGVLALVNLLLAAKLGGISRLWSLIPAGLAGMTFVWLDSRNEAREGVAEVAGASAFGLLPATFGVLAGWGTMASIALAIVMLVRAVPTVILVRTYLRLNKGRVSTTVPALVAAGAGLFLAACLVGSGIAPWPVIIFALAMTAGTIWLLGWCPRLAAKTVGMAESAFGVTMVLTLAFLWNQF